MSFILLIDTSTEMCSVAISSNGEVICQEVQTGGFQHAAVVPQFVKNCLSKSNLTMQQLNAVAVSIGPGSYTGLRVGLSFSKALCDALKVPLITISTLEMMTYGMLQITSNDDATYIPLLDARRMEVYTAAYNNEMEIVEEPKAKIVNAKSWSDILGNGKTYFGGPGVAKTKTIISGSEIIFIEEEICQAKNLANIASRRFNQKIFADLAYAEPFYLKNFGEITAE